MKFSKYVRLVPVAQGYYFIVNGVNGAIDTIDEEAYQICQRWIKQGEIIPTPGEEPAYQYLLSRGHLCEYGEDELKKQQIINRIKEEVAVQSKKLNLSFLLTYNCNLRCSYCCEKHVQEKGSDWIKKRMEPEMVRSFYNYLDREDLTLGICSLFGGEPLLPSNQDTFVEILQQNKKRNFPTKIITNGYYLPQYIDLLKNFTIDHIQVTLDGPREIHDRQRHTIDGQGTFDHVIEAILKTSAVGIPVVIRYNLDPTTNCEADIDSLLLHLKDTGIADRENIELYTAQYIGCGLSSRFLCDYPGLAAKFAQFPIFKQDLLKFIPLSSVFYGKKDWQPKLYSCNAAFQNRLIDPFGLIYSCDVLVGNEEQAIGRFTGSTIEYNPNHQLWLKRNIAEIDKCSTCWQALICGGGCGYQAMQSNGDLSTEDCTVGNFLTSTHLPYLFRRFILPTL